MIIMPAIVSKRFLYQFLPKKIYSQIVLNNNTHKFDMLDEYLINEGIELNCIQIIRIALRNLNVKKIKDNYIIDIDNNAKIGDYTYKQLIKLIDYGNLEVKGTKAVESAFDYINNHRGSMIEEYLDYGS